MFSVDKMRLVTSAKIIRSLMSEIGLFSVNPHMYNTVLDYNTAVAERATLLDKATEHVEMLEKMTAHVAHYLKIVAGNDR